MKPSSCANCARATAALTRRGLHWLCSDCDPHGAALPVGVTTGRGYECPDEVVGKRGNYADFAEAANRVAGPAPRGFASLAFTVTPGFVLERVKRNNGNRWIDRDEAKRRFQCEPWFAEVRHLGSDKKFHLFERPDVEAAKAAREQTEYDPIAALAAASGGGK